MIPFNKPYLTGKEVHYIYQAVSSGKISGDGMFTEKCRRYFESNYGFKKCLLTTSCTDALEMSAILMNIEPGDEVIMPSYTFVSTANAFVLRGARIIFADSCASNPNLDVHALEALISPKTKAIVVVHYAGIACDMDVVTALGKKYDLFIIEDAAQAIDSYYTGKDGVRRALGSIGNMSAFSFHETKNIMSGEGGMLAINDESFIGRAEIIREKGTNRSAFFRGEVDKYGWVDVGSSFLPSDIIAAFLYAQIENLGQIQGRRKEIWQQYYNALRPLEEKGLLRLPAIPDYATNNAHMFYVVCNNAGDRERLISTLKTKGILSVFHYLSLHKSAFYQDKHNGTQLPNSDMYSDCLVRLPLYFELTQEEIDYVSSSVLGVFQ